MPKGFCAIYMSKTMKEHYKDDNIIIITTEEILHGNRLAAH